MKISGIVLLFWVGCCGAVLANEPNHFELLTNGRFEVGDLSGWSVIDGNPEANLEGRFGIECFDRFYFFAGSQPRAEMFQVADVSQFATVIDEERILVRLSSAMGSWSNLDRITLTTNFLDANGNALASLPQLTSSGNPGLNSGSLGLRDGLNQESVAAIVPAGTRQIEVRVVAIRNAGSDNDGYLDNVQLILNPANASPPRGTEIIAHRGNSSARPENTIPALMSAFEAGADHCEVDIRLTSDGVAILMHDSTLNRTTNGSGSVSNFSLAQIKQLDAGSWFGAAYAGTEVPTLAEALVAVAQRGRLLLDIKVAGMGTSIQAALDEANQLDPGKNYSASDLWIWPGPNSDYAENIEFPQYLLSTIPSASDWQSPGYFEIQKAQGVMGWDMSASMMTAEFAARVRSEGMIASVYTINNPVTMRFYVELGVTAMETDFPEVLADLVLIRGDMNRDGAVTNQDIWPFVSNLLCGKFQKEGDMNADGRITNQDISLFVDLLTGG